MKLIVGLLTLLCVARLAHCGGAPPNQDAYNLANQDPAYLSFSDGFPDGTLVTFFYKYLPNSNRKSVYINFYGEELDPKVLTTGVDDKGSYPEIIAHIVIHPDDQNHNIVQTDTFAKKPPAATAQWLNKKTKCCGSALPQLVGKDWWRVDIYKFDNTNLNVFVQGISFKEHRFEKGNLGQIKSAYIFNSIDTNDVYIKYRIPGLVEVTPLAEFNEIVAKWMKDPTPPPQKPAPLAKREATTAATLFGIQDTKLSISTSKNTVTIPKFEKNMKIFITVWMGFKANQEQNMKPRIQIRKKGDAIQRVFTIFHEWVNGQRKSYIDAVLWRPQFSDMCTSDDLGSFTPAPCKPVECAVDGSASDLEHYRIERTGDEEIELTTYYAEADPSVGKMGKTCKTTEKQFNKMKENNDYKNDIFEIRGLNGAMILHADMQ